MKQAERTTVRLADDTAYGGKAIGEEFGWGEKKALYHLSRGHIPGAFKIGNLWALRLSKARSVGDDP
jgi:hypothetical protein